jgi:hypothetical protein
VGGSWDGSDPEASAGDGRGAAGAAIPVTPQGSGALGARGAALGEAGCSRGGARGGWVLAVRRSGRLGARGAALEEVDDREEDA